MRTATTQLMTRVRTWLLIAGLTALMIVFGAMLGGGFLWLFAGLAVIFNLVGYFYSDRIALRVARAQPLGEREIPELHRIVRDLAARAAIPMPRLYVMPGEQPNAFATGRNPQHSAIAVTQGLLAGLEPEHVRGVLAHEIAHIKNRDILVSSLAAMIAGVISAIANVLQFSFLFGAEDEDNPLGLLGALAAMILAPLGAMLLQLGVSRQREYLADATAARLLGEGRPLADALQTIARNSDGAQRASADSADVHRQPAHGTSGELAVLHPPAGARAHQAPARLRPRGSPGRCSNCGGCASDAGRRCGWALIGLYRCGGTPIGL